MTHMDENAAHPCCNCHCPTCDAPTPQGISCDALGVPHNDRHPAARHGAKS